MEQKEKGLKGLNVYFITPNCSITGNKEEHVTNYQNANSNQFKEVTVQKNKGIIKKEK